MSDKWKYPRPDWWHENCARRDYERLRSENERLRELVSAGKVIDELVNENKRLRKLLRQCQPFVARLRPDTRITGPPILDLAIEISRELEKELSDE